MAIERELAAGDRLIHSTSTREGLPSTPKIIDAGGTAGTGCTVTHYYADQRNVTTKIVIDDLAITTGDNASLGIGALIYTYSTAYPLVIQSSSVDVSITGNSDVETDTPEVGLGTVVGSGANATLGAVHANAEIIMEGVAMADINGTLKKNTSSLQHKMDVADTLTVFLNFADAWANIADATLAKIDGTVWLNWNRFA